MLFLTAPPQLTSYPTSPEVESGGSISLSCNAMGSNLADIIWKKNGVILMVNTTVTGNSSSALNSELVVSNTDQGDAGTYSCSVSTEAGSDMRSFSLLVTGEHRTIFLTEFVLTLPCFPQCVKTIYIVFVFHIFIYIYICRVSKHHRTGHKLWK